MLTAAGLLVIAVDRFSMQLLVKRSEVRVSNRVIFLLRQQQHRLWVKVGLPISGCVSVCSVSWKFLELVSEFKVTHDWDIIYPKFGLKVLSSLADLHSCSFALACDLTCSFSPFLFSGFSLASFHFPPGPAGSRPCSTPISRPATRSRRTSSRRRASTRSITSTRTAAVRQTLTPLDLDINSEKEPVAELLSAFLRLLVSVIFVSNCR